MPRLGNHAEDPRDSFRRNLVRYTRDRPPRYEREQNCDTELGIKLMSKRA